MSDKSKLDSRVTINGHTFKFDEDNSMYECRGATYFDEDHDQVPEPSLWGAALKLEQRLKDEGFNAQAEQGEKGWAEVNIF